MEKPTRRKPVRGIFIIFRAQRIFCYSRHISKTVPSFHIKIWAELLEICAKISCTYTQVSSSIYVPLLAIRMPRNTCKMLQHKFWAINVVRLPRESCQSPRKLTHNSSSISVQQKQQYGLQNPYGMASLTLLYLSSIYVPMFSCTACSKSVQYVLH